MPRIGRPSSRAVLGLLAGISISIRISPSVFRHDDSSARGDHNTQTSEEVATRYLPYRMERCRRRIRLDLVSYLS